MNIFEELERLKSKGFSVVITINTPNFMEDDNGKDKPWVNTVIIGTENDRDEDTFTCQNNEGESLEKQLYRAILEFDEKHPELL